MNTFTVLTFVATACAAMGARLDAGYLPPSGGGPSGGGYGQPSGPVVPILSYQNRPNNGDGSYAYSYETGNGIRAQEEGKGGPGEEQGTQAWGEFSYQGDDGQNYAVKYTADEGGFKPQGAHLPTPPPVPEEILASLAEQGISVNPDGSYSGGNPNDDGSYRESSGGNGRPSQSYLPAPAPVYRPAPPSAYRPAPPPAYRSAPPPPSRPAPPSAYLPPSGSFNPSSGYNY
ncbi:hypothetical protein GE061_003582 [Apolygus lucorum]|uniref:Uncharacterized protein n=1 Tax=Apolygus lucorum TaxID=248454 RepID=A0A8S9X6J0_APOLU|nr:hypothetical protein GE061_003582 [Apolygus lucorum]